MAQMTTNLWVEVRRPRWAADFRSRDHLIPGGIKLDASAFPVEDAVTATTGAGAAAGATTIPVTALSGPIPSGTVLDWTGSGEFSKLTANAVAGATSLTVEALDAAIEAADTATYPGTGKKLIKSGTLIGQTIAEQAASSPWGPAADADDYVRLLAFTVEDVASDNDGVMYRPGSVVKENHLPQAGNISATLLGKLRTAYVVQRGVS